MARQPSDREPHPSASRVRTARWVDPPSPDDGLRILICRYRPRGVSSAGETWHEWWRELAPTAALHAAFYGKGQAAIGFEVYRRRFLEEMREASAQFALRALAERLAGGARITLLCSSACVDEQSCHRSIVAAILRSG